MFVHRFARERLRALGQVEGKIAKDVPEVLFVCVQNAGRSQMAAALLDHYAEGRVHVRSAGSAPADQINPDVVTAMSELGIDVSKEFPKPMTDEVVQAADAVITMGCGDACPIYPGKRYEDWEVDDPADADLDGVRRIRDDISQRVRELLAELAPPKRVRPARAMAAQVAPTSVAIAQGFGYRPPGTCVRAVRSGNATSGPGNSQRSAGHGRAQTRRCRSFRTHSTLREYRWLPLVPPPAAGWMPPATESAASRAGSPPRPKDGVQDHRVLGDGRA